MASSKARKVQVGKKKGGKARVVAVARSQGVVKRRVAIKAGRKSVESSGRRVVFAATSKVELKGSGPTTLNERFSLLASIREQASSRQSEGREGVLAKKRGLQVVAGKKQDAPQNRRGGSQTSTKDRRRGGRRHRKTSQNDMKE